MNSTWKCNFKCVYKGISVRFWFHLWCRLVVDHLCCWIRFKKKHPLTELQTTLPVFLFFILFKTDITSVLSRHMSLLFVNILRGYRRPVLWPCSIPELTLLSTFISCFPPHWNWSTFLWNHFIFSQLPDTMDKQSTVVFRNVGQLYFPQTRVECHYSLTSDHRWSSQDWIGIFEVHSPTFPSSPPLCWLCFGNVRMHNGMSCGSKCVFLSWSQMGWSSVKQYHTYTWALVPEGYIEGTSVNCCALIHGRNSAKH